MSLLIETFALGPLETNCYVLRWEEVCWVVDPGMWPDVLLEYLQQSQARLERILLTHAHGDHIASVGQFKDAHPDCRFCCPAGEVDMLDDPARNMSMAFGVSIQAPQADETCCPGDQLDSPSGAWQVLDTAGHSPAGVSYYCPSEGVALTGDALFAGSIGRTDIPGADHQKLLRTIRENLLNLPPETRVLPGHGPETTIGQENRTNPFLQP
jgi:glyoxylase-like metal-dependent hydrolase (beta-lactamase superfamily II)